MEHYATEKEALDRRDEVEREIPLLRVDNVTLEATVKEYIADRRKAAGWKDSTVKLIQDRMSPFLAEHGKKLTADITPLHVRTRLDGLDSVSAKKNTRGDMRRLFDWAVRQGHTARNPVTSVVVEGKAKRGKNALSRVLSRKLDAACCVALEEDNGDALRALFVGLCLRLGLRRHEALKLRAGDVDLLSSPPVLQVRGDVKTKTSVRNLELSVQEASWLWPHVDGRDPAEYVFASSRSRSGHLEGKFASEAVERMCERAGITEVISPHGLRDTHAQLGASSGAAVRSVQEQLGHASPTVTRRHYLGASSEAQGAVLRARAALLGAKLGSEAVGRLVVAADGLRALLDGLLPGLEEKGAVLVAMNEYDQVRGEVE